MVDNIFFYFFFHLFKIEIGYIHLHDENHHYYIIRLLIRMKMMTTTIAMMILVMMMTTIERVRPASGKGKTRQPADKQISQQISISEIISLIFHHIIILDCTI